jgi:hypothetical protein
MFTARENMVSDTKGLMAVRDKWFRNYEHNLGRIKEHGGYEKLPLISSAVVVGAGWSLDRNIELLKGISVPVIATDKSFKRVLEQVKPLAVCALNTENPRIEEWLDAPNEGIYLIAPVTADPRTFTKWKGPIVFVNPSNTCEELTSLVQKETGIPPSYRGENVGIFALVSAVMMRAAHVALLGMNYCYRTEEEAWIATGGNHVVKIMSYTGEVVYTVFDWVESRRSFMEFCKSMAGFCTVVNCSEGGIIAEPGTVDTLKFVLWRKHCDIQGREK